MNSQGKRNMILGGGALLLLAVIGLSEPIADIRINHDATSRSISTVEARVDLGLFAFSYLHSWQRVLR